jgi:C4-dicarboxylate-specific signal transduction histidine kinase
MSLFLGAAVRVLKPGASALSLTDTVIYWVPCLAATLVPTLWKPVLGVEPHLITYGMTLVVFVLADEAICRRLVFTRLRGDTRISWMRLRRAVLDIRAGVAVAGLVLLLGTPSMNWLPLAFVPVLWMTHQGMLNALFRVEAMLAKETEKKARRLSRDLETTRGVLVHTQEAKAHLQEEVGHLSVVLRAARVLGSELDAVRLMELAKQFSVDEFQVESGAIVWGTIKYHWGSLDPEILTSQKDSRTFACRLPKEGADFGFLYLHWRRPYSSDADYARLLETFAYSLGLALENASRHRQVVDVQQQLVEGSKLRAIGQLAAGVAHELNSPLGAIRLATEALASQKLDERAQKRVKRAHDACVRALDIVNKLLVYSREKKTVHKPFLAKGVVDDTLLFLRSNLQDSGFTLEVEATTSAELTGCAAEIQQILINLILNAVQACEGVEESRRVIQISCSETETTVDFVVADRGTGIAKEIRGRVFEPFFTTKEVGQGTGLGLSISREIAEAHGGRLLLQEGPEDKGTRFLLRLPKTPAPGAM